MWQALVQTLTTWGIMLTAFWTMVLAIFAGFALLYAALQLKALQKQLEHTSEATLTSLSNQHNWVLFEHRNKLPKALPAWFELDTDSKWAWRVLHFNHLNLLKLFYDDHYKRKLTSQSDLDGWIQKSKYWFCNFRADNSHFHDDEIQEGLLILRQILKPEEGYAEKFIAWVRKNKIIPRSVFEHKNCES
jgi:hypothetical protein